MKSVSLLVITNLAIIAMLSLFARLSGLDQYLSAQNVQVVPLLIFSFVVGSAGAFISLLMSKWLAKRSMKVAIIDPEQPNNETEAWLLRTVTKMAEKKGITPPEVGIFPLAAPNAFATGATKNTSLVAVSAGLLQQFPKEEVEAIIGHEMAHVTNGDMVTSTLLQGVLNTFVIFFSRIIASIITRGENGRQNNATYFLVSMVLQMVFGLIASIIIMAHSRRREYHADFGGAQLSSRQNMINALTRLKQVTEQHQQAKSMPEQMAAFGIVPWSGLFMTHPPLEKRIEALKNKTVF